MRRLRFTPYQGFKAILTWLPRKYMVARIRRAAAECHATYMERAWCENEEGFTGWRWDKYKVQLRIVAAANRYKDLVIVGARHHSVHMSQVIDIVGWDALWDYCNGEEEQGFIDQYGTYHDRKTAWKIAEAAGQIIYDKDRPDTLFSENLY